MNMSIDKNIRHLRKQAGWTQEELAQRLFVTRQTCGSWAEPGLTWRPWRRLPTAFRWNSPRCCMGRSTEAMGCPAGCSSGVGQALGWV